MKLRNTHLEGFTLGDLIAELRDLPASTDLYIHAPTGDVRPGAALSYRGYYEDLAIQPLTVDVATTAGGCATHLEQAIGKVFTGYKGGRYPMHAGSLIWVSPWGESSGARVIGVTSFDETAWILTAPMRWSRT